MGVGDTVGGDSAVRREREPVGCAQPKNPLGFSPCEVLVHDQSAPRPDSRGCSRSPICAAYAAKGTMGSRSNLNQRAPYNGASVRTVFRLSRANFCTRVRTLAHATDDRILWQVKPASSGWAEGSSLASPMSGRNRTF